MCQALSHVLDAHYICLTKVVSLEYQEKEILEIFLREAALALSSEHCVYSEAIGTYGSVSEADHNQILVHIIVALSMR